MWTMGALMKVFRRYFTATQNKPQFYLWSKGLKPNQPKKNSILTTESVQFSPCLNSKSRQQLTPQTQWISNNNTKLGNKTFHTSLVVIGSYTSE